MTKVIPYGYCKCGCGEKTKISRRNNKKSGTKAGEPNNFVNHHNLSGEESPHWKDGKSDGYKVKWKNGKRVGEHKEIAETALGHPLPPGAVVHHLNGKRDDNRKENLVICQNKGYHSLLHHRERRLIKRRLKKLGMKIRVRKFHSIFE